jgi:sec-independent protein translocase protein TatC
MTGDNPEFADEAEPGVKKSFWGHLQDLRVALIRSAVALIAALLLCLFQIDHVVQVLEYPLRRLHMFEHAKPSVAFEVGATRLGPFRVTREQFPGLPPGDAPNAVYLVGIEEVNHQPVVTLKLDPKASTADPIDIKLSNFSPAEAFMVAFHVALYAAIAVSAPFWIYFLGGFILPALNVKERSIIFKWLGWAVVLFFAGVLSTYFFLLPVALRASVQYSELLGFDAYNWRAEEYINFTCKFLVGMGAGFQFPLVVLFLVKIGVLTHKQLAQYRRHVIVISLFLGAILTTPEVITQVAMAVPLYLLYEICIWIAWYWERKKRRAGEIVDI